MNSCQLPVRCRMMPAKTRQRNPTPVMRWVFIIWFVNFKERGFFLYFQKTDLTVCLIFIIVFLSSLMFPGNVIWWREAGSGSTEPQKCGRRLRSCCPQYNWSLFISALKKKTYIYQINLTHTAVGVKWNGLCTVIFFPPVCSLISCSISPCVQQV